MRLPFHRSLRRLTSLYVAKRALAVGTPERALLFLQDPVHGRSAAAERLRQRALSDLCRLAARRARDGRDASAGRMLGVVAAEDFDRAQACRERIGWLMGVASGEVPLSRPSVLAGLPHAEDRREPTAAAALTASNLAGATHANEAHTTEAHPNQAHPTPTAPPSRRRAMLPSHYLRMTVDDGGDWLIVALERVRIGHGRGGRCDLPFLADVGVEHAVLESAESLRGGRAWRLTPMEGERVDVDDATLSEACVLRSGAKLAFGTNLAMTFSCPRHDSGSAVLRLARGAECLGAGGILLWLPGEEGALRIGPATDAHVEVGSMEDEVTLVRQDGFFELRRSDPRSGEASAPPRRVEAPLTQEPGARVEVRVPRRGGAGAPVSVTLAALTDSVDGFFGPGVQWNSTGAGGPDGSPDCDA